MGLYSNIQRATRIVPTELTRLNQWVCWKKKWNRKKKRDEKVPFNPRTRRQASTSDSNTWGTYEQAVAAAGEHDFDGIGFVLTPDDPFSFVDLDDCRNRETGDIEPWAAEIVERFDSYTGDSPSGEGLRIAVRASLELPDGKGKAGSKPTELFVSKGFVTITGNTLPGYETINERQGELEDFYETYCKPEIVVPEPLEPLAAPIDLSDAEVLEKARNGTYGREFIAVYDFGDASAYGGDESRADYATARTLRFWSGGDVTQVERLFKDSALVRREKMQGRVDDLTRRAVNAAMAKGGGVYNPAYTPVETAARDCLRSNLHHALFVHSWSVAGRVDAAATDYAGYKAILRIAYKPNKLRVDVSIRKYMEEAGIADYTTAVRSLARLQDSHRLVKKVRDGDKDNAATYRILTVSKPNHIKIGVKDTPTVKTTCDGLLTPLPETRFIRNTSPEMPEYNKNGRKIHKAQAPLVNSVGKPAAMALDIIHATQQLIGGPVPLSFVAERLGVPVKNLKRRQIKKLLDAGLVDESNDGYQTPTDIRERLRNELRLSESLNAANFQRQRHQRERIARAESIVIEPKEKMDSILIVTNESTGDGCHVIQFPGVTSLAEYRKRKAA